MEPSENCFNLIKEFEGCKLHSYQDSVGVWTIGYGHTKGVNANQTIIQDYADELLQNEVTEFACKVDDLLTVEVTQNQFDALVSLAYNIGISGLAKSCIPDLVRVGTIDARLEKVWRSHCKYKKNGLLLESKGLIRRRKEEWELFSKE